MSRNGAGVYSLPAGYLATTGATITSSQHNPPLEDLETDMNTARPVVAGGTGASSASGARTNLGVAIGSDVQAHGDVLDDLNTLGANAADAEFLVGTGAGALAWEKLATAVASLGLTTASLFATYGGTADVVTLTTGLSLSSLTTGQQFRFRATAANTGATTINVDGIGALTAKTPTGAALPADYIRTDVDTLCTYDGTDMIVSRAVETGSGANGHYTRWEDGTQHCRLNLFTMTQAGNARCEATWTFPAAFVDTDIAVTATARPDAAADSVNTFAADATPDADEISAIAHGAIGTTSAEIAIYRSSGLTNFVALDEMYASVAAYGRWY